jgi:site-specific recombinase
MNRDKYWFLILFLLLFGCARRQPQSTAPIFDEKADARHDIATAITNAEGSQRNIVLIFGANW